MQEFTGAITVVDTIFTLLLLCVATLICVVVKFGIPMIKEREKTSGRKVDSE